MRHRKRKALAALAISGAAIGAGVGVGMSSAGAATAAPHHTATVSRDVAKSYTPVRPDGRTGASLTSSTTLSATKSPATTDKSSSKMTGPCTHMGSSPNNSNSTGS